MSERTDKLFPRFDESGRELVERAMGIAETALAGMERGNGHPFFEHPLNVARIADEEVGLPAECIAAVFLHEAARFFPETDISSFGKDVRTIVDGLNRISTIKPKDTRLEADNYKKLIVSYSKDPRVTVLKIADRLEIMRSLDLFPKASRERKILETLMLYIPLAHQLGLYNMKSEMEDIYFRYAEPDMYRTITNKLKSTEKDRQKLMTQFIEPLKQRLSEAGINYKLKVRTKTAWSIWKKMQKQKVPFEGVYDVFAIRFIIDCDTDRETEHALCWKVFSYVTEEYESDTRRLRDWISNPKPNGYESLHITVKNREGSYLEVQIRTKRMDDMAENGLASHWSYKGIRHEAALDKWLASVRFALEHPDEARQSHSEYYEDDLPEPPSKEIFVFTPTGELRKLPAGATLLDFAFEIHTNLGIRCTGGKVNGKVVPLKEELKTGDVVEIMSSKNQKPTAGWLNFVVTSKARNKIRQKLSEAEFQKAADGKELLGRRLKNWKLELDDEVLASLMKKLQYKTLNSFYAAVGEGIVDVSQIKDYILASSAARPEEISDTPLDGVKASALAPSKGSDDILVIDAKNVKNIDYKMAKCCNPVFGDDVFGFVSIKDGVKIHRMCCPNAARLMEKYPYRIQKVKWSANPTSGNFQTTLRVIAAQEPSVVNEIMDVVNSFKAVLRGFNVTENPRNGTYDITIRIAVTGNMELDKVISQLKVLHNVMRVVRG
ncbi:MAG: RelA/SpoT family protein [Candidatus Cryptobacteroides sp.]